MQLPKNPTRFILIRHGETEWNAQGRFMGQLDSPLTARGIAGASQLRDRLKSIHLDAIYSSDLVRATRTAEIIAASFAGEVRFDPRLRERNLGIFQGLTLEERAARYPQENDDYAQTGLTYVIPTGESAEQCIARIVACLDELASRHDGETVLIVTHGGVLLGFFAHVFGLSPFESSRRFLRPNTAWNVFTRDHQGWVMETWGDVSHLEAPSTGAAPPWTSND